MGCSVDQTASMVGMPHSLCLHGIFFFPACPYSTRRGSGVAAFACWLSLPHGLDMRHMQGGALEHPPRCRTGACSLRRRAAMASARARCCPQPRRHCATRRCCSATCARRAAWKTLWETLRKTLWNTLWNALRLHPEHAPPRQTRQRQSCWRGCCPSRPVQRVLGFHISSEGLAAACQWHALQAAALLRRPAMEEERLRRCAPPTCKGAHRLHLRHWSQER